VNPLILDFIDLIMVPVRPRRAEIASSVSWLALS